MNLNHLIANPWAAALGWTLLHSFWQGVIVSALLALVLLATRSPRIRYAAGCLALLSLFAAFIVTLIHLAPDAGAGIRVVQRPPGPVLSEAMRQASNTGHFSLAALAPWLPPFWLLGVVIFYLRYAAGFFALRGLKQRGTCGAPQIWQQRLHSLRARLRVSRPVRLLESSLAESPLVLGHFRPLILIPAGLLSGLPAAQIELILLHELAHIRRHDYLLNALQNLLDGLLFYHPAVWWISRVVRAEREKCCDDLVVGLSGSAHQYACALAALEETRCSAREPALAAKGGSLMKRIHRLLYPKTESPLTWTPLIGAAVLLVFAAAIAGAWQTNPPRSTALKGCPESTRGNVPTALSGALLTWLNQDVFYIIDDAERAAFLKLPTNDERECFVAQFWERRNPTPGSAENKAKVEHYRRIDFANAHFASSVPGWQTDRGHMYILYGPPDEIDAHPQAAPHPYETWGYKHVEGVSGPGLSYFTFIDRTGHGDYHLAPSNVH